MWPPTTLRAFGLAIGKYQPMQGASVEKSGQPLAYLKVQRATGMFSAFGQT